MNKFLKHLAAAFALAVAWPAAAQTTPLPYETSFETPEELAGWQISNSNTNGPIASFVIGSATSFQGNRSVYLSADGGATMDFDAATMGPRSIYNATCLHRVFNLPAGKYTASFACRSWLTNYSMRVNWIGDTLSSVYGYYNGKNLNESDAGIRHQYWHYVTFDFEVTDNKPGRLAFSLQTGNISSQSDMHNFAAAIDNVQICRRDEDFGCASTPSVMRMHRSGNKAVVEWAGNASEYQLQYFFADQPQKAGGLITNINQNSYVIDCASWPEDVYTFRVRAICGNDTSAWAALPDQLVYDAGLHCLDYLNFYAGGVKPQYGSFWNPTSINGAIDYRFYSTSSRHAVHYMMGEKDSYTEYQLSTTPADQVASVRLGNSYAQSQAEAITYTLPPITEETGVLQMQYAVVMQVPGHTAAEQPRFTLEMLDSAGNLLDPVCGVADFTASTDLEGWHVVEGETPVVWKDWTLVGMNMMRYAGQTVQIRLTTKDCANGEHFGYAYFSLGCSSGMVQGTHCGKKPESFSVAEGFYYRWYKKYEPGTILSREREFHLTNAMDTCTYSVDLIQMTDTSCYFTLDVSSLAYLPKAHATLVHAPQNCVNYVQVVDSSRVMGFYWDAQGNKVEVTSTDGCEAYYWDFGQYGTSTERNPRIALPDEGDTLHATLRVTMENGECEDIQHIDFVVPPIGTQRSVETHYMCEGVPVEYYGVTYTVPGNYTDTFPSWTGCDSLSTLSLIPFEADTIHYYDTICASNGSITWNGQTLSTTGDYFASVPSKVLPCDSIYNVLHLHVYPLLDMNVENAPQQVCSSAGTLTVPYSVRAGIPSTFDLLFDYEAQRAGFADRTGMKVQAAGEVSIDLTEDVLPGQYGARIVFYNLGCDNLEFPLSFTVAYNADSVITQRWNNILALRRAAIDKYGEMYAFQWYKDGQPISGGNENRLYLENDRLEVGASYVLEMTRRSDGVRARSCPYVAVEAPDRTALTLVPSVVPASGRQPVKVHTSEGGTIRVYSASGLCVSAMQAAPGESRLLPPAAAGLYLVRFTSASGETTTARLLVVDN